MGIDYTAIAVLGVVLPREALYTVATMSHREATGHASSGGAFCGVCGAKNGPTVQRLPRFTAVTGVWDSEDGWPVCYEGENLGSWDLWWDTDRRHAYLGIRCATDHEGAPGSVLLPDLLAMRDQLAATLEPLGLWTEAQFGLWAVLYWSY